MQQLFQTSPEYNKENYFIINIDEIEDLDNVNRTNNQFHLMLIDNNLFINIRDNIKIEKPIYILNNNVGTDTTKNFSQLTINSGKWNHLTIIEKKTNTTYDTNIISQDNAIINYYLIQKKNSSKLKVLQHYNSFFDAKLLSNQSSNNSLWINIDLLESNAVAELNILQNTRQNFINQVHLSINHLAANCSSTTLARALVDESAKIELAGKIIVAQCANKNYADLQTKNLIRSKKASIISCPELVINNKDVICKHGSSTGNLNPDHLFYMQTRGLTVEEAAHILLTAFFKPIIQKIQYLWILDEIDTLPFLQ
jgi:Fe-S cluster assembly scaffold protein SufB